MDDMKLEKTLDIILNEIENTGDPTKCPIYHWLHEFRAEISHQNTARLKSEIPVPDIEDIDVCDDCPIED